MLTTTLTKIPFLLRGLDGEVTVEYQINENPAHWGFGESVLGAALPPRIAVGFPVVQATVDYKGVGYGAFMAWIQVVRYQLHETDENAIVFDVAPQMKDSDVPYFSFGIRPTLFDAPGIDQPEVTWDADSFLVHTPDGVLSREIRAVTGFKWGYRVRGGQVEVVPVSIAEEADWGRNMDVLRERFPTWEFGSSWS